jgi:hypothetical protein
MTKTRLWTAFTALAVILVFAIGYFLLLSPQKAQAAKNNKQATELQTTNDGLRTKVARLKVAEKGIPAAQARIAAIDARIPASPAIPSYIRFLTAAAAAAHVELVSVSPSQPTAVQGAAAAPAPVAPATGATGATPAAPAAAPPASALSSISVTFNIVGNYFAVQAFLKQLESSPRATVVSTINLGPGALPRGAGAKGAVPPGWQTLSAQITATVFMSNVPPTAAIVPPATTGAAGTATAPAASATSTAAPNS